ncbi:hypothetical protein SGLAM104S_01095 [Streptomyces glaucescens]
MRAAIEFDKWLVEQLGLEQEIDEADKPEDDSPGSRRRTGRAVPSAPPAFPQPVGKPVDSAREGLQPPYGLLKHPGPLAEGEPDERRALLPVVVEDRVGDGHHARPLGSARQKAKPSLSPRGRMSVVMK